MQGLAPSYRAEALTAAGGAIAIDEDAGHLNPRHRKRSSVSIEQPFADFVMSVGDKTITSTGALKPVAEETALDEARTQGSIVMGLVPFDPAQPATLWVPQSYAITERTETDSAKISLHELPAPTRIEGIDNPRYRQAVGDAVARMNNGEFDKVVLARTLTAHYDQPLNITEVFTNLTLQQPRAYTFSVKLPGSNEYLMGASPELVFKTEENGCFQTHPLAGSAKRSEEPGGIEDMQIGEQLMRSAKDRAEHATVVDDIRSRLAPLTQQMNVPAVPELMTTPQLWHLGTKITGVLQGHLSSLDGARAIHPTPAICGTPRDIALDAIQKYEDFDRGYFGGLVGYMDANGNGSWALVLRCARVSAHQATLFAGAGIVSASQPDSEHSETATKLGTFGRVLGISTR